MKSFGEGGWDAALHANVQAGDGPFGHRLRKHVETVHEALGAENVKSHGQEQSTEQEIWRKSRHGRTDAHKPRENGIP